MKSIKNTIGMLLFLIASFSTLSARPSSVFWTNCTTDIYQTGTAHIDVDNYFTVFRKSHHSLLPPQTGIEFGVYSFGDWSVEAGVDIYGAVNNPLYFNVGVGIGEGKLFCNAPSFKIGIFNMGTKYNGRHKTNQNIVDIIIGKSLPEKIGGNLFLGEYYGTDAMGPDRHGFMIAYERFFCPAIDCNNVEYNKWKFCADYASGKNTIGGGGFAVGYYFNPDVSILTGPVWFNEPRINGHWKWSVQLDISFSVFNNQASCS